MQITSFMQREGVSAGLTVASIHIEGRSTHWPDLPCQPGVYVEICRFQSRAWQADCYLELANRERTQWSVRRNFETRDKAATEASRFAMAALELLRRSLAGEEVETPGAERERVARARAKSSSAYRVAAQVLDDAREEKKLATTPAQKERLWVLAHEAETHMSRLEEDKVAAFHEAHHWSEFAEEARA